MTDAVARLPYSLRLADQFWLAAHDDTDPLSPRVNPRALQLGCAGALLLELLADRVITLDSAVRPALETTPAAGGDYLCGHLLNEVHAEPDQDLPTWVEYLATFAAGKVRCRLQTFDVLEERTATVGRVRPVTYPVWRAVDRHERASAERTLATLFRAPGATLASGTGMLTWSQQIDEVSLAGDRARQRPASASGPGTRAGPRERRARRGLAAAPARPRPGGARGGREVPERFRPEPPLISPR